MKKILVTGFKPFLGGATNPSQDLALKLESDFSYIKSLVLPVEFENSYSRLKTHLLANQYDYVVMIGQASGRKNICLEKVALNWVQTEHADEAGVTPRLGSIATDKSLALMSEFPIDEIYTKLKKDFSKIEISFSAGTFVCNDLYFRTLNEFDDLKSVFVHVPLVTDLAFVEQYEIMKKMMSLLVAEQK